MTSVGIIVLGTRVFTELVCCSVLSAYSYVCPCFITQYLCEEKNKNQKVFLFMQIFFSEYDKLLPTEYYAFISSVQFSSVIQSCPTLCNPMNRSTPGLPAHHRLNGHGFGWTPGVSDGQGGLVCCGSWGCKESDTTE